MNKYIINIKNIVAIVVLTAVFSSGCTEKMDIDLDSTYTRLVVEGSITTDTTSHLIRLSLTSDYFIEESNPSVSGAEVTISDGENTWPLAEQESGYYYTDTTVYGVIGKTYTLKIQLAEDINGHSEYSASSTIQPIAPIDSITLRYREQWKVWEVQCWALDPPETNFYFFQILKNDIILTDTIDELMIVDDAFYNGNYTNGIGVGWIDEEDQAETLVPGDVVKMKMASITEEYAEFLWNLQTETGYKAPLFSGPPANVKGNLSNGAIGYFAAYSVSYASRVYQP